MASRAERIAPAFEGLDTEASPGYVTKYKAPRVTNFLPARSGKLTMRGPLNTSTSVLPTGFAGAAKAFWPYSSSRALVVEAGGNEPFRVDVDVPSTTSLGVIATAVDVPASGTRSVKMGGVVYGIGGHDLLDVPHSQQVMKWGGTGAPVRLTNSPALCIDLCVHLNRLFVLTDTRIAWTDRSVDGPTGDLTTDWEDDVSGLDNEIILSLDNGETPRALARVGTSLAVITSAGVVMIRGDAPSKFVVQKTISHTGCRFKESVCSVDDGVYFMGPTGFMYYDGSELVNTAKGAISYALAAVADSADNISAAALPFGNILISVDGDGLVTNYLLHVASRSWVTLSASTSILPLGAFYQVAATATETFGWDSQRLWKLSTVELPERSEADERGYDTKDATVRAIPATWHSRVATLAMPHNNAVLRRLLIDYNFLAQPAAALPGWYVTLVDGAGTTLLAETQVPTQTAGTNRARAQFDVHGETTDVQVRMRWIASNPPPALAAADVFDVTIEYDQAQQT